VGASGRELDALLYRAGLAREPFRVHNVLSCRPPGNWLVGAKWEGPAIRHCEPNLDETIAEMRPKVILALGNTPLRRLTGKTGIQRHRGWIFSGPFGSWVVPTFHPSYLLPRRGQTSSSKFTGVVVRDIKLALQIAQQGFTREEVTYLEDPEPERAERWAEEALAAGSAYLAFDIETPYKQDEAEEDLDDPRFLAGQTILRISFAWRSRRAMTIPFTAPYRPVIDRLMGSPLAKVGWNSTAFDIPILKGNGVPVGGETHDAMWAWKVLQPALPRGLEFAASFFCPHLEPWKHESANRPTWYSAVDADATITTMLGLEAELRRG
jgi:uracil-DNA glycosylase family 4